jgi:hypothetical protein
MDSANEGRAFSTAMTAPSNTRTIMRRRIGQIVERQLGHVLERFLIRGPKAKKALICAIDDSIYLESQDMQSYSDLTTLDRKVFHFSQQLIITNIRAEHARAEWVRAMQMRNLQMMQALDLNRNRELGLFQQQS